MLKYRIVASKIAPRDTDRVLWLDYNTGVLKAFNKGTWQSLGSGGEELELIKDRVENMYTKDQIDSMLSNAGKIVDIIVDGKSIVIDKVANLSNIYSDVGTLKDNVSQITNTLEETNNTLRSLNESVTSMSSTVEALSIAKGDAWVQIDTTNPSCEVNAQSAPFIRGRRCLVKPTDNGVAICYLDENNSNLYHDGVTEAKLDGTQGEFMVDLPEFYFKGVTNGDIYTYNIWQNNVKGAHKSRRVLLGAVEATSVDNVLHSIVTGNASTGNLSSIVFHQQANALGAGFDIVDYEAHCKVAWMQYARYGNLNSQAIIGSGVGSFTRIIGTTASLGNNDGADSTNTTIFGLENWWGDKWEWIGGFYEWKNANKGEIYVFDGFLNSSSITGDPLTMGLVSSSSEYRKLNYTVTSGQDGNISKMLLGEYGDLLPIEFKGSSSTFWADYGGVNLGSGVALRSCYYAGPNGGAACFILGNYPSYANAINGSRLLYRGNIEVIEDPASFISL